MNAVGNYVHINDPLQQVVDRQDEQLEQLKETNEEMKEQLIRHGGQYQKGVNFFGDFL